MLRRILLFSTIALTPAALQAASVYTTGNLNFSTDTRQSSWGSGNATRFQKTEKLTLDVTGSSTIGGILGEKKTTTVPVPNPAYGQYLIDNPGCPIRIIGCPDAPSLTIDKQVTIDERTGATVTASSKGEIGAEVGYLLDGGSVNADLQYTAQALVPDKGEVSKGEAFNFNPMSLWVDGQLDTQSPTAEAFINAYVDVELTAKATGCVFLAGCQSTGEGTILDTGVKRQEIVGIDPNEIQYIDGFIPGLELRTPLANQSASVSVELLPPGGSVSFQEKDENGNNKGAKQKIGSPIGIGIDVAEAEISFPIATGQGQKSGDQIEVKTQADFLSLTADVDTLVPILPPGGLNVDLGILSISADAYDVDIGPKLDAFQDFVLKSSLMVDLSFDKPVEVVGEGLKTSWKGLWDKLPDFKVFDKTVFTPVFSVMSTLTNKTGLTLGFEMTAELFKLSASVGIGPVTLLEGTLGPLFKKTIPFAQDFAKVSIFDETFALGGFNPVAAAAFVVDPNAPGAVPLPTGLPLMAAGIAMFGLLRRRQRVVCA